MQDRTAFIFDISPMIRYAAHEFLKGAPYSYNLIHTHTFSSILTRVGVIVSFELYHFLYTYPFLLLHLLATSRSDDELQ